MCWEGREGAASDEGTDGGTMPCDSQDGGADACSVPSVVPGSRGEGSALRCSVKVTWNELKTRDVVGFHRRYAFKCGAYPIRMQGTDRGYNLGGEGV